MSNTEAIVLALPTDGAAPDDEFAGLPLALRTVLTLQKEGATRIHVVGPTAEFLVDHFRQDRRVKAELHPVAATSTKDGLLALRGELCAPAVVGAHDVVVDPAIYRALRAESIDARAAIVATREGTRVGPIVIAPSALTEITAESFELELTQLLAEGRAERLDVGKAWAYRVTTADGRKLAFRALFEACRKPVDGVVARNLNRHISIFISKRIVGLPVTPNMLSVMTFLLGVAGAFSCARGGYWPMLLGAFLFQWNSILDGVDGELARVRFQHSKLGQWLDTVSDDASNLIFYAGVAIGARGIPFGPLLAICAWVGIGASVLATAQYYIEMVQVGSGDLYAIDWGFDKKPPAGIAGKLIVFFRNALKKDFAILFFLALAAFGVLPYALPIVAGGAVGTLIAATLRNIRRRRGLR
jgi:phosphatidylglycerophosphate synthase